MIIYVISTNLGMAMGRGSYPPPCPVMPAPPRPVLGETFFPPSPPQHEFSIFFLLLNYIKLKNSISMTTIDLLANQFATNLFTSINLHEITIHA